MWYNNQHDWKKIRQKYIPGILMTNSNKVLALVCKGNEEKDEDWQYEMFEPDSIFMLIKPPRLETEQAMMAAIRLDMLQGEKIVKYFCYVAPWELFNIIDIGNEEE